MRKRLGSIEYTKVLFLVALMSFLVSCSSREKAGTDEKKMSHHASTLSRTSQQTMSIIRDSTDLPPPIKKRQSERIRVDLETTELEGNLADGITYTYWTFNGKVPGPFVRVRVGDKVEVHLKNPKNSMMMHSIDFHAASAPGGGGFATQAQPGEEKSFTFKALKPGLYMYHCGTPMVAAHIASAMYGMILVEPKEGLRPVDHEFYIMQGEVYTQEPYGTKGHVNLSEEKVLKEEPTYYVFNGSVNALTKEHPLQAKVGETIRIFFGVGGPDKVSSFHVIGQIFDQVYNLGSLTSPPLTDVQTVLVPPGGTTMVEFTPKVPGKYVLVDHALSRVERGLSGWLLVTGKENPETFQTKEHP